VKVSELFSPAVTTGSMAESSPMGGVRPTQTASKTTSKQHDHISGTCVLDVIGRRKLIGSNIEHTPPGRVLFMASDGSIEIQSIKSNKLELDRYEKPAITSTMDGMTGP
jgi:hypothetical protein